MLIDDEGREMTEYLQRMAHYNQWMNRKLYEKVQLLSADEVAKDRGAFFVSILGTLNHLLVGDLLWFQRFAARKPNEQSLAALQTMPKPRSLKDTLFENIDDLQAARETMDALIIAFSETWDEGILKEPIQYRNTNREKQRQPLGALLQHVFNHQTHHRGQVTTLLFQAGIDPEVTDLLVMIMDETNK